MKREFLMKTAIDMVLLDAFEKNKCSKDDMIEYMKTEIFEKQVNNYYNLLDKEF